jgi:hypothetical protein
LEDGKSQNIVNKHGQRQKWTPELNQFALGIYYLSSTVVACFLKLKKVTENWSIAKRLTVLLFDEMSIQKGLEYNNSNDCFEGFQDSLSL